DGQRRQGRRSGGDRRLPPVATPGPVHPAHPEPGMTTFTERLRVPGAFVLGAVLLLGVAPLALSDFRLSLLAKYLCYAIVAVGVSLAWGRGGLMVLGQGVFFGLGGYAMAMHLKLTDAAATGAKLPD